MRHTLGLSFVLTATWLLLSGHFDTLLLSFGVASVAGVVWMSRRMDIADEEGVPLAIHTLGLIPYVPWLLWQVVVSNLAVARWIWSPSLPIRPQLVTVTPTQRTAIGRVLYANSITLTPGTVSVRMYDGEILVHALHDDTAEDVRSGDMDARVTRLERAPS